MKKLLETIILYIRSFFVCRKHSIDEIPKGSYCYTIQKIETDNVLGFRIKTKTCPFLDSRLKYDQNNGWCHLLKRGDWFKKSSGLLWDSCKECGINDDNDYEIGNA